MSDTVETKADMSMMPGNMPMMTAPTFMQRLCQLLNQPVSVFLNGQTQTPVTGTLAAIGQDYLELQSGTDTNTQVTLVPFWSVLAVTAAGASNVVCPPPTGYPTSPIMGGPGPGMGGCMPGMPGMPECPMPGMGGGMGGMMPGMGGGIGMMDVKKENKK